MWLFLIFVAVPIIEIALFIQVGGFIGLWPTLAVVVLTAVVGTTLMRAQGTAALNKLQNSLQTGQNPADPIANGAFILIAGLLLLTPGFFTDSMGMLLLVPPVRQALIRAIAAQMKAKATVYASTTTTYSANVRPVNETVLEGDFEVVQDNVNAKPGDSGWTRPEE